jgi:hypothetical protein
MKALKRMRKKARSLIGAVYSRMGTRQRKESGLDVIVDKSASKGRIQKALP